MVMFIYVNILCYYLSYEVINKSLKDVFDNLRNNQMNHIQNDISAHKIHLDIFRITNKTKHFAKYKYKLPHSFTNSVKSNKFSHYHVLCQQNLGDQRKYYFCHSGEMSLEEEDDKKYNKMTCGLDYPKSLDILFINNDPHHNHNDNNDNKDDSDVNFNKIKCYLMWFHK